MVRRSFTHDNDCNLEEMDGLEVVAKIYIAHDTNSFFVEKSLWFGEDDEEDFNDDHNHCCHHDHTNHNHDDLLASR